MCVRSWGGRVLWVSAGMVIVSGETVLRQFRFSFADVCRRRLMVA